jgi:lipid-A-disaccharide synthase
MKNAGGYLVKHYRDLAFMGFVEVILHLRTIIRNIKFCREDILQFKPDAVILVDYPGFNLRIAEFAKKAVFTVFYLRPVSLCAGA